MRRTEIVEVHSPSLPLGGKGLVMRPHTWPRVVPVLLVYMCRRHVTGLIHGAAAGADASCVYLESFSFTLLCTIGYMHTVLPNCHIVTPGTCQKIIRVYLMVFVPKNVLGYLVSCRTLDPRCVPHHNGLGSLFLISLFVSSSALIKHWK